MQELGDLKFRERKLGFGISFDQSSDREVAEERIDLIADGYLFDAKMRPRGQHLASDWRGPDGNECQQQ